MGRLKGHMVYKIIATEFLPLRERPLHDQDEDTYYNILKTMLRTGPMYFSYSLDITNSFQRQASSDLTAPLWKRADDRFFWNRFIQSDLIDFRNGQNSKVRSFGTEQPGIDAFILPVMYGMMRISQARVKSTTFSLTLITRRSRHRAGTRYFSRGIDENGNVSNYNETEQIVILNDSNEGLGGFAGGNLQSGKVAKDGQEVQILSYVQTRGSVPAYWAEINTLKYTPMLQIRGVDTALSAARKHFEQQIRIYGENYLVNLVNQKGREVRVKEAYEAVVQNLISSTAETVQSDSNTSEKLHILESNKKQSLFDKLHYVYFDFHNETKGLRWHRALLLLDQLKDGLTRGGYFRAVDMPGDVQGQLEVRYRQNAVVRTNCMDCLDRTNVVQTMVARWALTRQLTDLGILQNGESQDDDPTFAHLFRNLWADNADVVSNSYSGTGALKTDFTRTGERTKAGALQDFRNSVTRYIKNNFLDGPRQDGFDVFLGTYRPSTYLGGLTFVDRRPAFVQAVPYLLVASVFMVLVATLTRQLPNSTIWPMRIFTIFWMVIGLWCWRFIYQNGMLYVS
jgi:phosphatidylinositol 4-phosphatase